MECQPFEIQANGHHFVKYHSKSDLQKLRILNNRISYPTSVWWVSERSGDLNSKHLNKGNIGKVNFYLLAIQMLGYSYSGNGLVSKILG